MNLNGNSIRTAAIIVLITCSSICSLAQTLSSREVKVKFFSSTPIEDIKAATEKATAVYIAKSSEIAFLVPIKSFQFSKGLMQEHFNENYLESVKYPTARFSGKLNQPIDITKNGEYSVTASGNLLIHGVSKPRNINGRVRIMNGVLYLSSEFNVACADHNIKIPKLVMTKIAEVIKVNVDASLKP